MEVGEVMKDFDFSLNGEDYNVKIVSFESNSAGQEIARLKLNDIEYKVEIKRQKSKTPLIISKPVVQTTVDRGSLTNQDAGKSLSIIKAPIPGLILKVNVKVNDKVKMGDTVAILEAMKMQQEIHASQDGVIKEVKVKEGESLQEGDTIVVLG